MMIATAIRKSRGLILLIGQYEVQYGVRITDDHDDGNDDNDDEGHSFAEESLPMTADSRWSLNTDGK